MVYAQTGAHAKAIPLFAKLEAASRTDHHPLSVTVLEAYARSLQATGQTNSALAQMKQAVACNARTAKGSAAGRDRGTSAEHLFLSEHRHVLDAAQFPCIVRSRDILYVLDRGHGLQAPCGESGSDCGFRRALPVFRSMIVVAVAVVMWESPQGFPRGVGRVESRLYGFPCFPYPGISTACFWGRLGFNSATRVLSTHGRSWPPDLELSPYVLIFRKAKTNTTTPNTRAVAGARISAHSVISPLRSLWQRNIAPTNPTIAARTAATPDITNAMKLSPAVDFIVVTS